MNIIGIGYIDDLIYKQLHQSYMNDLIKEIHNINTIEYQAKKCYDKFFKEFIRNESDRCILNKLEVSKHIINEIKKIESKIYPHTKFMKVNLYLPAVKLELWNNGLVTKKIQLYINCYDGKLTLSSAYYKEYKPVKIEINGIKYDLSYL